jgi:hypothetical protein
MHAGERSAVPHHPFTFPSPKDRASRRRVDPSRSGRAPRAPPIARRLLLRPGKCESGQRVRSYDRWSSKAGGSASRSTRALEDGSNSDSRGLSRLVRSAAFVGASGVGCWRWDPLPLPQRIKDTRNPAYGLGALRLPLRSCGWEGGEPWNSRCATTTSRADPRFPLQDLVRVFGRGAGEVFGSLQPRRHGAADARESKSTSVGQQKLFSRGGRE